VFARKNRGIRVPEVRLIDENGQQVGIVPTARAIEIAVQRNLDLVEVAATAKPPVCKIMDYGKYLYENSKKAKAAKKKQHQVHLKEMRFRPKTEEHDYQFKLKHIREFLEQGSRVKAFIIFRGREMAHKEMGFKILERLQQDLADIAEPESDSKMEGRHLSMMFLARSKKKK
jgi:translation initiation factor IF-3